VNIVVNEEYRTGMYPKLMVSDEGTIYIFFKRDEGVVLVAEGTSCASGDKVGTMENLRPYKGKVILED